MHVLDTPLSLPSQKRKPFASITCLLPTKTKSKTSYWGNQSDFSCGYEFQVLFAKGIKKFKIKRKKKQKSVRLKTRKGQSKQKIGR